MDIKTAQKFLQDNHRACIAVRQKDGLPQMTLVTPGIDPQGRVIITSRGTTYKIKHIRRDPERVAHSLLVVHRSQGVALRALPWAAISNAFGVPVPLKAPLMHHLIPSRMHCHARHLAAVAAFGRRQDAQRFGPIDDWN